MMGECEEKSDLLKDRLSFSSVFFCLAQHSSSDSLSVIIQSSLLVSSQSSLNMEMLADCFLGV